MEVEEKLTNKGGDDEDKDEEETSQSTHVEIIKRFERNFVELLRSEHKLQSTRVYKGNNDNNNSCLHFCTSVCSSVWMKFASKHQKSPSHKNNNIQNCEKITKESKKRILETSRSSSSSNHGKSSSSCSSSTTTRHSIKDAQSSTRINNNNSIKYSSNIANFALSFLILLFQFIFYSTLFSIVMYCMVVLHKPTQSIISRNTQDLIYPLMRSLRILALPYVERFPQVSDVYEDSCLISNPYFEPMDIDCWPCESARNIVDLTGLEFSNFSQVHGIPFIVTENLQELGIQDIREICLQYIDLMKKVYVHPNLNTILKLQQLVQPQSSNLKEQKLHVLWKISRVSTARLLRKYFPKPNVIPTSTEVSVQHFLYIDQSRSSSYSLPMTEFANVFVMQASGARYIVLIPTEKCKHRCKVVSSILRPKDVLFYNWLYWRPMSVPVVSSTNLSVTYVGSFY